MLTKIRRFLKTESGATAIEYGLIAALVAVASIAAFDSFGQSLIAVFDTVSNHLG